jgi:hypothetical protein
MSGLHRDKRATHNFSVIWKVREDQGVGAGARATKPIRGDLVDPASTAFEDEQ